jgi:hypothetical protein
MNSDQAMMHDAGADDLGCSSALDRMLLRLTVATGYAFLGFFGWLLTL